MSFVDKFLASVLYCFPYSYRSFKFLKALAKSNGNLIAIAFKSEKERFLQKGSYQKRSKELSNKKRNTRLFTIALPIYVIALLFYDFKFCCFKTIVFFVYVLYFGSLLLFHIVPQKYRERATSEGDFVLWRNDVSSKFIERFYFLV